MCFFFLLFMFVLFFVITSACLSEIAENNACYNTQLYTDRRACTSFHLVFSMEGLVLFPFREYIDRGSLQ